VAAGDRPCRRVPKGLRLNHDIVAIECVRPEVFPEEKARRLTVKLLDEQGGVANGLDQRSRQPPLLDAVT
jgi:hypothetical protein